MEKSDFTRGGVITPPPQGISVKNNVRFRRVNGPKNMPIVKKITI